MNVFSPCLCFFKGRNAIAQGVGPQSKSETLETQVHVLCMNMYVYVNMYTSLENFICYTQPLRLLHNNYAAMYMYSMGPSLRCLLVSF